MALAPFALSRLTALAVPRAFELGDKRGLFELGHRTQHLPDQVGGWRVLKEGIGTIGRYQVVAELAQHVEPGLLHDEIAGKPIGRFHDDGFDAVAFQALQQIGEAGPLLDAVCA